MKTKPRNKANSAQDTLKPIAFHCAAPNAKFVYLTGDFNQWTRVAMECRPDGWWYVQISLCRGHHQYRFVVDGKPVLDRFAASIGKDQRGQAAYLLSVC